MSTTNGMDYIYFFNTVSVVGEGDGNSESNTPDQSPVTTRQQVVSPTSPLVTQKGVSQVPVNTDTNNGLSSPTLKVTGMYSCYNMLRVHC